MNTWALIPAKGFDHAKSRLGPALTEGERSHLAEEMFHIVLRTVRRCDLIRGALVISDSPQVTAAAQKHNVPVMRDSPGGLAACLDAAIVSLPQEADAALILMGDLPHLQVADVAGMVERLEQHAAVVAPDRQCEGTNALGLRRPPIIPTAFGRYGSFDEHMRRLRAAGCEPAVLHTEGLGFDVDSPDDLPFLATNRFRKAGGGR
jgi:2-phospho-L-lactate guanylyltransferase